MVPSLGRASLFSLAGEAERRWAKSLLLATGETRARVSEIAF
jgi:hypothetical protein